MTDTKRISLVRVMALGAAAVCLPACGSSDSSGGFGLGTGSGSGFGCSLSIAGQEYCYAYSDLSSSNTNTANSACKDNGGTIVNSCPTDGLVGCCAVSQSGISYQACYYFGTAATDKMACNGTWTDGSAALPSTGGGGNSGSSSPPSTGCTTGDAGCACYPNKTCNGTLTCTSGICAYGGGGGGGAGGGGGGSTCGAGNGLCCPGNYCTIGSAKGYQYSYSDREDGGGSSATLASSSRTCVSGRAVGASCETQSCFSTYWGGGLGINLNQAQSDGATPMSFTGAGSAGVSYAIDNLIQGMRIVVGDSTTDYCVNLNSSSGTIPWRSFNSMCWNGNGTSLSGPPSSFTSIRFQVVADAVYDIDTDFDFCVTSLSF